MAAKVLWIGSDCLSVWKFSWNWLISFFLELSMMLVDHVMLCVTELYFLKIIFFFQKWGNYAKNEPNIRLFEFTGKFNHYFLRNLVYNKSLYYLNVFLHKSHIWVKTGSWDIDRNALGLSDFRIFKSTISVEQKNPDAWFFVCWYKFLKIKSSFKNIGMDVDEIKQSDFSCVYTNSGKLKVSLIIF